MAHHMLYSYNFAGAALTSRRVATGLATARAQADTACVALANLGDYVNVVAVDDAGAQRWVAGFVKGPAGAESRDPVLAPIEGSRDLSDLVVERDRLRTRVTDLDAEIARRGG